MKKFFFKWWLAGAALLGVLLIVASQWGKGWREDMSVTLDDGVTTIRVEELEITSTWLARVRGWLGEEWEMESFLSRMGWQKDRELSAPYFGDEAIKTRLRAKLSVNSRDRFLDVEKNPVSWLTAREDDFYELNAYLSNAKDNFIYQAELTSREDNTMEFRLGLFTSDPMGCLSVYLYKMKDGSAISGYIPLPMKVRPISRSGTFLCVRNASDALCLPHEKAVNTGRENVLIRLESLPVDFDKEKGLKIFHGEKEVTEKVSIARFLMYGGGKDVEEREILRNWEKNGQGCVLIRLDAFLKSPDDSPPEYRIDFPPITMPESGKVVTFDSKLLNPNFPRGTFYFAAPGVYYFSGNPNEDGLQLKLTAVTKQEKLNEFKQIIEEAKKSGIRFNHVANDDYDLLFWERSDGTCHNIVRLYCPHLFLMPTGELMKKESLHYRMGVWNKEGLFSPRRIHPPTRGWMSTELPNVKSGDTLHYSVGESFFISEFFKIKMDEATRQQWLQHWREELAKKEAAQEKAP